MKFRARIANVAITYSTIEIPAYCGVCGSDLCGPRALEEQRVCTTMAFSHFESNPAVGDDIATDTPDDDADATATLSVGCANCGARLAVGNISGTES